MKYDVKSMKAKIRELAQQAREAKATRRAAWQAFSLVERERKTIKEERAEIDAWWMRRGKALDTAQNATANAAYISDAITTLCSARAHIRGVLHMKKRCENGKYRGWTMADQEDLVRETLKDYELPEISKEVA